MPGSASAVGSSRVACRAARTSSVSIARLRPEGDRLVGRDQGVAPEQGREPGHARRQVVLLRARAVVEEEPEVRHAPADEPIEQLVVRGDRRRPVAPGAVRRRPVRLVDPGGVARADRRLARRGRPRLGRDRRLVRPDRPLELDPASGRHLEAPAQDDCGPGHAPGVGHVRGGEDVRGRERDLRPAKDAVPPDVAEGRPVAANDHGQRRRGLGPIVAADLEDVGGVGAHGELDRQGLRVLGEVRDDEPFPEGPAEDPVPGDPEGLARERSLRRDLVARVAPDLRVRQLDRAAEVLVGVPAEESRSRAVDGQDRARQDPGVAGIQPEATRIGMDVAERVREQVEVPVLEDANPAEIGGVDDVTSWRGDATHRGFWNGHDGKSIGRRAANARRTRR